MSASVDVNYGSTLNTRDHPANTKCVNGIPLYHIIYRSLCILVIMSLFICLGYLSLNSHAWNKSEYMQNDVESQTNKESGIGGFYTDPNHYDSDGTLAGTRMISDFNGIITIIGTDDGTDYWTVTGQYTDKLNGKISIDFTPKGGPIISGEYHDGYIEWTEDGNKWSKTALKDL